MCLSAVTLSGYMATVLGVGWMGEYYCIYLVHTAAISAYCGYPLVLLAASNPLADRDKVHESF